MGGRAGLTRMVGSAIHATVLGEKAARWNPPLPPKLRGLWHSRRNRLLGIRPASTEILTVTKAAAIRDQFAEQAREVLEKKAGSLMRRLQY